MKLIVVDVQKGITDNRLYNFEDFIKNLKHIIKCARENHIEVIYVQHDDGAGTGFSVGDEEFEIFEDIKPLESEKCYVKTCCSCFSNKELKEYLKDEKDLIFVGLQTNYCIDASIKSAFDLGYNVMVPNYCNSTFDNDYMLAKKTYAYYNELIWPGYFAKCLSMDETIQIMIEYGHGNFRSN